MERPLYVNTWWATCCSGTLARTVPSRPIWVPAGELADNLRQIEAHPRLGVHWMIDRDGTVRASVPEQQVADHVFTYSGRSIGIELVNDGDGQDPFPPAQIDALVALLRGIVHATRPSPVPAWYGIRRRPRMPARPGCARWIRRGLSLRAGAGPGVRARLT